MALDSSPLKSIDGGLLVAFEGIDGAGKTTQALMARDALIARGFDALYLREPTDGQHGHRLREIMIAGRENVSPLEEFQLFRDDREEDVRLNISPALQRGAIICIDRYYISSMAYQGALGLYPEFIRIENEKIAPRPHAVLYFWIPVGESIARIQAGRSEGQNHFELQAYQQRVYEIFEKMKEPPLTRIDARNDPQSVHTDVMTIIDRLIADRIRS
jgi:dTMP kinase